MHCEYDSWMLEEVHNMIQADSVAVYQADQCMNGLKAWGAPKWQS